MSNVLQLQELLNQAELLDMIIFMLVTLLFAAIMFRFLCRSQKEGK